MFFTQDDRTQLQKITASIDGNKVSIITLSHEVNNLITILRQLTITIEQMANDQETLKQRMICLENKCTPKPSVLVKSPQAPKKK